MATFYKFDSSQQMEVEEEKYADRINQSAGIVENRREEKKPQ